MTVEGAYEGPCIHKGRNRCWSCMTDNCYDEPTEHVWWDFEDVEHAGKTGRPAPSGLCGCAFCGWPALPAGPHPMNRP